MDFIWIIGSSDNGEGRNHSAPGWHPPRLRAPPHRQSWLGVSALPCSLTPVIAGLQRVLCKHQVQGEAAITAGQSRDIWPRLCSVLPGPQPSLHFGPAGIRCHQPCSNASAIQQQGSLLNTWPMVSALSSGPLHYPNPFLVPLHEIHAAVGMRLKYLTLEDKEEIWMIGFWINGSILLFSGQPSGSNCHSTRVQGVSPCPITSPLSYPVPDIFKKPFYSLKYIGLSALQPSCLYLSVAMSH